MRKASQERALEICLLRLEAGDSLEQILISYPQWADEFRPILQAAKSVREFGKTLQPSESVQAISRAKLLQAATAQRTRRQAAHTFYFWRSVMAVATILVVVLLTTFGTFTASASALPGDTFYSFKIAVENARLSLTRDPIERIELEQDFYNERAEEIKRLIQLARTEEVNFSGCLVSEQDNQWQVGDIQVRIPANAQVVGQIKLDCYVQVEGKLQPDGVVEARRLQAQEFEINGKLEKLSTNLWQVNGVAVIITPETIIQGDPFVGAQVEIKAYLSQDKNLRARLVEIESEDHSRQENLAPPDPLQSTEAVELEVPSQAGETSQVEERHQTEITDPGEATSEDRQESETDTSTDSLQDEKSPESLGSEAEDEQETRPLDAIDSAQDEHSQNSTELDRKETQETSISQPIEEEKEEFSSQDLEHPEPGESEGQEYEMSR